MCALLHVLTSMPLAAICEIGEGGTSWGRHLLLGVERGFF